ncbi:MAG: SH3 domain-containing protein [Bradyrhizobium sp.]
MKLKGVFVAAMLLTPTAALAAPGIVTASVGLRAGPGPAFPMVDRIPQGTHVNIHGCLRGDAWCDVSWSGDRGWVSSQYLEYLYRNRYVYLPDYVDVIDVPVVPFVLSSYWSSYYSGRPWYHRRAHWSSYWQSHARFATRMPTTDRSTRLGRTERRTAVTEGRTRTRVGPGVTRHPSLATVRGVQATRGRMAHVNGANRTFPRTQQPMVRRHEATRFSAAPAARRTVPAHIAQPNVGRRVGGPPMNAHAQMGAPRAAPAMPHVGGGGAPHIGAGPHVSGGRPTGGPPGHQRH